MTSVANEADGDWRLPDAVRHRWRNHNILTAFMYVPIQAPWMCHRMQRRVSASGKGSIVRFDGTVGLGLSWLANHDL